MPVNGIPQDTVPINDRGFSYGDGLFETILIHHHQPVLLEAHLDRLALGAGRLGIALDRHALENEIAAYAGEFPERGILKVVLTRGSGGRGYRPGTDLQSLRVLSLHSLPEYGDANPATGIAAFVCRQRLAIQPALAGLKHLNRLEQVLASQEWPGQGNFMEGLMLDMDDNVIEGTRSNLFWAEQGKLFTPALSRCGVTGIMRNYLLENISGASPVSESPLERVLAADEAFVCNSIFGIWPLGRIQVDETSHDLIAGEHGQPFTAMAKSLFDALLKTYGD